jgi:hypothetical protein
VDESCTPQIWELPGAIRPVGPPPISTTFPSPTTRCEGSQLATAARSYGQQTAADRRHHLLPRQRQLRHRQRRLRPRRAQPRELLQLHGRVQHPRLARPIKFCRGLAHPMVASADQRYRLGVKPVHTVLSDRSTSVSSLLVTDLLPFIAAVDRFCRCCLNILLAFFADACAIFRLLNRRASAAFRPTKSRMLARKRITI